MIAQLVPINSRVADIGTDHGYLPIFLAQRKGQGDGCVVLTQGDGSSVSLTQFKKNNTEEPSPCVIASDINKKPLMITKKNIKDYNCENEIELRLESGLSVLNYNEVDVIIIAGMGGILIGEMINEAQDILRRNNILILQPMQAQKELRKYLLCSGFKIIKDRLVKEDSKIYEIMVAKKGTQVIEDEIYYELGTCLESNPKFLIVEFLEKKKKSLEKATVSLLKGSSNDAENKRMEYKERLTKIKKILSNFQQ